MKTKLAIFLMLVFTAESASAQFNPRVYDRVVSKKPVVQLKKFDFRAAQYIRMGAVTSKWVPYHSANKDMIVQTRVLTTKIKPEEGNVICKTETKRMDVNSATFMNSAADLSLSKVYPGAIYPANDFLQGNYNRSIKQNRTPIVLKSDDSRIGKSVTVNNPSEESIADAKKDLLSSVRNATQSNNLETKYKIFYSSNEEMTKFLLSGGASGYGAKVNATVSTKGASNKVVFTIDAYKSIYAVDAVSQGDNSYFSEIPSGVNAENLVIVNSVVYGTRIYANLTVECKSSEDAFALAASYSGYGFSANLNLDYLKTKTSKQIDLNYKQVGGENREGTMTTDVDQLQQIIDRILNNTNYYNAVPIAYNIRDLAGNNMGIQSTVDKYTETVCYKNQLVSRVFVQMKSGSDGKNDDNYLTLNLYDSNNKLVARYVQPRKIEFEDDESTQLLELQIPEQLLTSQFVNGGKLVARTDHRNGKDDWDITEVKLSIYAEDDTMLSGTTGGNNPITWQGPIDNKVQKNIRRITRDNPEAEFHFTKTFNAR